MPSATSKIIDCLSACHIILRCKSKCCKNCHSDCFVEEASGPNQELKYQHSKSSIKKDG